MASRLSCCAISSHMLSHYTSYLFLGLVPGKAEVFQLIHLGVGQGPVLARVLLLFALLVNPTAQLWI